jgi:GTP-binding protein Era
VDGVREELPHSLAALVTELVPPEPGSSTAKPLTRVFVTIFVERSSQKAIILGHKGSRLADVGRRARLQIEPLVGTRVYLDLHVAVAKDWQRDPKQLRKLGFDN